MINAPQASTLTLGSTPASAVLFHSVTFAVRGRTAIVKANGTSPATLAKLVQTFYPTVGFASLRFRVLLSTNAHNAKQVISFRIQLSHASLVVIIFNTVLHVAIILFVMYASTTAWYLILVTIVVGCVLICLLDVLSAPQIVVAYVEMISISRTEHVTVDWDTKLEENAQKSQDV